MLKLISTSVFTANNNQTCVSINQGFVGGDLACNSSCDDWDTTSCLVDPCGNGLVDAGEVCDGSNLDGQDCVSINQGFTWGDLACSPACDNWDVSGCHVDPPICGDGQIEGYEQCDDGGATGGDGCSDACQQEGGWLCTGQPSQCIDHHWSKSFGAGGEDLAYKVAADSQGNVIITGQYRSATIDFGGLPLSNAGGLDIYVVKLDFDGNHLWSASFGSASDGEYGFAPAIDSADNIIIAGQFKDTVSFNPAVPADALTSAGDADAYVAMLAPDGSHLWSRRFGDAAEQSVRYLAVDSMGDIWALGIFRSGSDAFGPGNTQIASGVVVDGNDNVVLTGYFDGAINFNPGVAGDALVSAGDSNVFVAVLDSAGAHRWSRRFGTSSFQGSYAVALDPSGAMLMVGSFFNLLNFGASGDELMSVGNADIYVAKLPN